MKTLYAACVLASALALGSVPALAANADHPYTNIDHSNDKGNNTGDSQVDKLNQAQIDSARAQSKTIMVYPGGAQPPMQPGMHQ